MKFRFNSFFYASHFVLVLAVLLQFNRAQSAACCGGAFAGTSVIASEDKALLSASYNYTEVIIDNVDAAGIWSTWSNHQKVKTLKIEGAHVFADRWQAGFLIPLIERSRLDKTYSGLGDIALSTAYEYLPEWDYHPVMPKGIGFLQLMIPTGKAKADSEVGGLDSRGNGFWALGMGTLLTKAWTQWDAVINFEVHKSFEKEIQTSTLRGRLNPGFGASFGLGAGYNTQSFRFGGNITWNYEDPIALIANSGSSGQSSSVQSSPGAVERYATAVASLGYLPSGEWTGTISYSDQTLFGDPVNTSLGRGVAVQLQRRWSR